MSWEEGLAEGCERMAERKTDADGKTSEERFAAIREFFLEQLRQSGHARKELYRYPKVGSDAETEASVVLRWARMMEVAVNTVLFGIQRAFETAEQRGDVVTSFRYCEPHITNAAMEAARRSARRY